MSFGGCVWSWLRHGVEMGKELRSLEKKAENVCALEKQRYGAY